MAKRNKTRHLRRKSDGLIFTRTPTLAKQRSLFEPCTEEDAKAQAKSGHVMTPVIDEYEEEDLMDNKSEDKLSREALISKVRNAQDVDDVRKIVKPYAITNIDGRKALETVITLVEELIDDLDDGLFK